MMRSAIVPAADKITRDPEATAMAIKTSIHGETTVVTIDRIEARNAVNPAMADALFKAFIAFDRDDSQKVAILAGVPGAFCAGFDLKAAADIGRDETWFAELDLEPGGHDDQPRKGPMGPTRLVLSKPVIAAISGPAAPSDRRRGQSRIATPARSPPTPATIRPHLEPSDARRR